MALHSPASNPAEGAKWEVRLYGLDETVTTDDLVRFFRAGVHVLGVLLHPSPGSAQWAQIWLESEADVRACTTLGSKLLDLGITMETIPPSSSQAAMPSYDFHAAYSSHLNAPPSRTPAHTWGQGLGSAAGVASGIGQPPPTPVSAPITKLPNGNGNQAKQVDSHSPLPRNLYVMGLPLDMTQSLFAPFGLVEHSTLLSQLDGMGRRRGFVLMSSHREAVDGMQGMSGTRIDGKKIDVSWALIQRQAAHFAPAFGALPNRVVHPPLQPTRRSPPLEASVIVEDLDPAYFPSAGEIQELFSHFGSVTLVTILSTVPTLSALIQFDHPMCATALVSACGMIVGSRAITTKRVSSQDDHRLPGPLLGRPASQLALPSCEYSPFRTWLHNQPSHFDLDPTSTNSTLPSIGAGCLRPDSQPLVPFGNTGQSLNVNVSAPSAANPAHQSSSSPTNGTEIDLSTHSRSGTDSTKHSQGSHETSKSVPTSMTDRSAADRWSVGTNKLSKGVGGDRWYSSTAWCESPTMAKN